MTDAQRLYSLAQTRDENGVSCREHTRPDREPAVDSAGPFGSNDEPFWSGANKVKRIASDQSESLIFTGIQYRHIGRVDDFSGHNAITVFAAHRR